ncbi:MAG: nuclear transport factor 2 family protein [Deltaproteobacteria bacterium]|nr:nuclear transport factor 2 family protein [Deltaproteobacteria bacterium]
MLSDERQILNLIHRYAELQDAADFEAVAALFRDAAFRIANGPTAHGFDAVLALKRRHDRVHEDGTLRTKHVTTNTFLELAPDGQRARARSYFVVYQATTRLPLQCIAAGRYHDAFERPDGAWRFTDRLIQVDLIGDMSEHTRDNPLAST